MNLYRIAVTAITALALSLCAAGQGPVKADNVTGKLGTPTATVFKAGNNVAYISTSGSDANAGTRAAPLATSAAALSKIGGEGDIIILAGDYTGLKFDLSSARKVSISSEPNTLVRSYLGETISSGFTADSSNVYYKVISTVIPIAADRSAGGDAGIWVFEDGTAEGAITAGTNHPLQQGRTNRLDHTRLTLASTSTSSAVALPIIRAGAAGKYWFDASNGRLYIKATDLANLASSPKTYRIPSQTTNASFVYGGGASTWATVRGIEAYYGKECFDFSACAAYRIERCLAFGSSNEGVWTDSAGYGEEMLCQYAANANDGAGSQDNTSSRRMFIYRYGAWANSNGDEGVSDHGNVVSTLETSLLEYNSNSGTTPWGSWMTLSDVTMRGHTSNVSSGIYVGNGARVTAYNCTSDGDYVAIYIPGSAGVATLYNHKAINSTSFSYGAEAGCTLTLNDCYHIGSAAVQAGAGTITRTQGSPVGGVNVEYKPTTGVGLGAKFDSSVSNLDLFKLDSAATDLYMGINGSANWRIGSTTGMEYAVGNGYNIRYIIQSAFQFTFKDGGMDVPKTVTAGGTTGARTINTMSGTVNFAAAAASLVVTNSLVSTTSVIICTVGTNDTTMKSALAVAGSPGVGQFTIYPNAAPTAETRVNFILIN